MPIIQDIRGYEILDSRGNPTVAAQVRLSDGAQGDCGGAVGRFHRRPRSAGILRDGDSDGKPRRYFGKGVHQAVAHIDVDIARTLAGMPAADQAAVDDYLIRLDGTPNKSGSAPTRSWQCRWPPPRRRRLRPTCRFIGTIGGAKRRDARLPLPMMNIVNGGAHADNAWTCRSS